MTSISGHICLLLVHTRELFDVTLRLLVNLTNPELLLFKEELPEDKETRNYYLQIQVKLKTYFFLSGQLCGIRYKETRNYYLQIQVKFKTHFLSGKLCRFQCCGSWMFIPDPDFFSIPDPGSRIQKQYRNNREGWEKNFCPRHKKEKRSRGLRTNFSIPDT